MISYMLKAVVANFQSPPKDCLQNVLRQTNLTGIVDSQGNQVSNIAQAVGITYQRCTDICGSGSGPFDWHDFSKLFTAWILPCLALISQLPYGANDTLDNFEAMVLTVGSPMLAAYSLALSVTSNRWIVKRFRRSDHPNSHLATQIVASLQQVSFDLPREEHVLPSLIALRQNDLWWRRLDDGLNYSGSRWTLAAIMSMVYVASAYVLTWVDRIENKRPNDCQWQSASTLWISLLPIIVCYLQLSPKSDFNRINRALEYANQWFYVATETNQPERSVSSRTIVLESDCRDTVREDELCTTPICFYARVFSWLQAARQIADAFDAASQSMSNNATPPSSRSETILYCTPQHGHAGTNPFGIFDIFNIFTIPVIAAFFLQWGITGPAVIVGYYTPTKGLDCLSGSLLFYGCSATIVWMLCVLSSALTRRYVTSSHGLSRKVAGLLAIITRLLAKTLAGVNALWMILLSLMQISNVYNSCYCKSRFPRFGNKAYIKLKYSGDDSMFVKLYWVGGMIMISLVSLLFIVAINLLKRRPEPRLGSLEQAYESEYVMVNLRSR